MGGLGSCGGPPPCCPTGFPIPLPVLSIPSYFRLESSIMRPRMVSVASSILVASQGLIPLWVLEGKEDKRPDLSRQLHQTPFWGAFPWPSVVCFPRY